MRKRAHSLEMRVLLSVLALTACAQVLPAPEKSFRLISIDGRAFAATATISFAVPGRISGQAPCNSYSGALAAPLPGFSTLSIVATEIGCADLAAEQAFFTALSMMTQADVTTNQIRLGNAAGQSMVFVQP